MLVAPPVSIIMNQLMVITAVLIVQLCPCVLFVNHQPTDRAQDTGDLIVASPSAKEGDAARRAATTRLFNKFNDFDETEIEVLSDYELQLKRMISYVTPLMSIFVHKTNRSIETGRRAGHPTVMRVRVLAVSREGYGGGGGGGYYSSEGCCDYENYDDLLPLLALAALAGLLFYLFVIRCTTTTTTTTTTTV